MEHTLAPVWWEAITELRERSVRIETKLDTALVQTTGLMENVRSLETDRIVQKSDIDGVRGRIAALEADRDARDITPGGWREWKNKVDGVVATVLSGEVATATRNNLRAQDYAFIMAMLSVAVGLGGLVSRFIQ